MLDDSVRAAYFRIIKRLEGKSPEPAVLHGADREQHIDRAVSAALAARLLEVSTMDPQARGYAFERFLKDAFDAYGMSARASFRLTGEQIDGSFVVSEQTYLLEARWRNARVDVETLRAFNAKVEDKASWSRGLIISQSGFTLEGLHAFGRGKSVVCMDGLDLHEVLSRRLDLAEVIRLKVRRAAESGDAFVPPGVPRFARCRGPADGPAGHASGRRGQDHRATARRIQGAGNPLSEPLSLRYERHSEDEDRFVLVGMSLSLRTLVVCHCYREDDEVVRIFSARKANRMERAEYERR